MWDTHFTSRHFQTEKPTSSHECEKPTSPLAPIHHHRNSINNNIKHSVNLPSQGTNTKCFHKGSIADERSANNLPATGKTEFQFLLSTQNANPKNFPKIQTLEYGVFYNDDKEEREVAETRKKLSTEEELKKMTFIRRGVEEDIRRGVEEDDFV